MFFALSASQQTDCAIPIMTDSLQETRRGVLFAMAAFFIWGLFPLYWKPLGQTPALQILCHRIVWSAVFVTMMDSCPGIAFTPSGGSSASGKIQTLLP